MILIDTLRPEHRRLLRRLRKRIANRENMRRYRSDINYMQLCPGVDLPLDAGTCGRLISPESTRCTACRKRRHWLLTRAFNPVEVVLSALLDGAAARRCSNLRQPATSGCGWLKSNPRPKRICTRSGTKAAPTTSNRAPGTEKYPSRYRTTASEPDTASPGLALTTPTPASTQRPGRRRHRRRARSTTTPSITFPPSSRPSTSSPTSAVPAFVGEDSRARRPGPVR